jgi:plasmid maintenance system antidote protein VapI
MKNSETVKSVPQLIRNHLEERGTKQVWLAEKAGISQEHISNVLADRVLLTDDVLNKINEVLGTDFKK